MHVVYYWGFRDQSPVLGRIFTMQRNFHLKFWPPFQQKFCPLPPCLASEKQSAVAFHFTRASFWCLGVHQGRVPLHNCAFIALCWGQPDCFSKSLKYLNHKQNWDLGEWSSSNPLLKQRSQLKPREVKRLAQGQRVLFSPLQQNLWDL